MKQTDDRLPWRLLGGVQGLQGHAYGSRYPSLVFSIEGQAVVPEQMDRLWRMFEGACEGIQQPECLGRPLDGWADAVQALLALWQASQVTMGLPVFEAGRLLVASSTQARCVLPTLESSRRALAAVVYRTFEILNTNKDDPRIGSLPDLLRQDLQRLGLAGVRGSNVPRFVRAAFDLGMPLTFLLGEVVQYGVGSRARWMDSSFTDVTPAVSAKLARNKFLASALLRQSGIPVPSHQRVADVPDAVRAAGELGYPVVVKPADLDGGVGVEAGLCSEEEVRQAFEAARQHSNQILVEKHVEGRDYRLTVFQGEVIWAIERVPAGVTGDGRHTVGQLVAMVNADPRRGTGQHAPLKRIELDEAAMALMDRQGLTADAVPEAGQFVRLRRAANVASGGTPVAVFERSHPDNARLAVRAAEALRLDLAGIDMLIPDIAVSWRESGAAICEVNGQPNLGQTTAAHLYAPMLRQLVPGTGRIPVVVVLGASDLPVWLEPLMSMLNEQGLNVGCMCGDQVTVGGEVVHRGAFTILDGGRMLRLDRRVDAMLLMINDDSVLRTGLPVEQFDAMILAGDALASEDTKARTHRPRWFEEILRCTLPACDGVVVFNGGDSSRMSLMKTLTPAVWRDIRGMDPSAIAACVEAVRLCVARRIASDGGGSRRAPLAASS